MSKSARLAGAAIGSMFFAVFGAAWVGIGTLDAAGSNWWILALVLVVAAFLFILSWRQFRLHRNAYRAEADLPERKRAKRLFNLVNTAQWVLIFAIALLLSKFGLEQWIVPAIIFTIGAHFIPLSEAFSNKRHLFTGSALMLLALIYPITLKLGPSSPFGPIGAGVILWISSAWTLLSPLPQQALAE